MAFVVVVLVTAVRHGLLEDTVTVPSIDAICPMGGLATLWTVRRVLIQLGQVDRTRTLSAATDAFRSYRKSLAGRDPEPTVEIDAIVEDDDGSPG